MDIVELQRWSFIPDLPPDVGGIRNLLQDYSKIPAEEVDEHLIDIRRKAWSTSKAPFIGRWKFLFLLDQVDDRYQQMLFRLKLPGSKDAVLDLGCGLGNFIRQLKANGVSASQLFGADVDFGLIALGWELFRDKDSLGVMFANGDILNPRDDELASLDGKVTMIHADSFFHQFDWSKQLFVGTRIVKFLQPDTVNALIFGRQAGISDPNQYEGIENSSASGASCYIHSKMSFQRLWDKIGMATGTRWVVDLEPDGTEADHLPGQAERKNHTLPVKFTILQIPNAQKDDLSS